MKFLKYTLFLIGLVIHSQSVSFDQINDCLHFENIEKISNYRLTIVCSLLVMIGYYSDQKIMSFYKNYPLSSLVLSCLTSKLLMSIYTKYNLMNKNLFLLKTVNQIYIYLKYALLIEPNEEKCFMLIEQYSSFSINEIEEITKSSISSSLKCLNCSSISNVKYECPKIDHIICDKLDLAYFKSDPEIYKELVSFEKNKSMNKEEIFEKIGKKINQKIDFLIKNKTL